MQPQTCTYTRGVGQGHVHHKAPLKIIILNVVLLLVDDDVLYVTTLCRYLDKFIYPQQCGSNNINLISKYHEVEPNLLLVFCTVGNWVK